MDLTKKSLFSRLASFISGNQSELQTTNIMNEEEIEQMKIGIISGSVREGNNATAVSQWIYDFATKRNDEGVEYEIVNLADYQLPLLGAALPAEYQDTAMAAVKAWSEKMASLDGYIFVTPEYNHSVGGALKNALDFLKPEVANKAAAMVGYGSLGGARAHENMRSILGELSVASVRTTVNFSLMSDFENMSVFKPNAYNEVNANGMLDDLLLWSKAFQTIR
ncbi:NAD(P)H-dependent oxidoreductase [Jeotgalibaca sp. YN-L-12]|nr:NAD(P)H-dependent oxidoreductase [Jeotgalibaca caeni]MDE1548343.1 NAD(P)H-dependent oxidoreductase [Jeotgalibaca caeni]